MKRTRKQLFLDELNKKPVISNACSKVGLSRQTVYRWKAEDEEFSKKFDESMINGIDEYTDIARIQLLNAVIRGERWAIKLWLERNDRMFMSPEIANQEKKEGLAELIKRARNIF